MFARPLFERRDGRRLDVRSGAVDFREEWGVKVLTDEGITGLGGAIDEPFRDTRVVTSVIDHLIAPVSGGTRRTSSGCGIRCGRPAAGNVAGANDVGHGAISGIDVACWDILGQSVGTLIYELLGGDVETLDAEGRVLRRGADDNGRHQRRLRRTAGPEKMAHEFEGYDAFWLEDPLDARDVSEYAKLQDKVNVNIFIGVGPSTMELSDMIDTGVTTNLVSISIEHSGGISEAMKVATLINSWNLKAAVIANEPLGSLGTFHVWKAVPQPITEIVRRVRPTELVLGPIAHRPTAVRRRRDSPL